MVAHINALNHRELDEGQHVVTSCFHNGDVRSSEQAGKESKVDHQRVKHLLSEVRFLVSFLKLSCQMKNLVYDYQKVVPAPLHVSRDNIRHDLVELLDDLHFKQLSQLYLS